MAEVDNLEIIVEYVLKYHKSLTSLFIYSFKEHEYNQLEYALDAAIKFNEQNIELKPCNHLYQKDIKELKTDSSSNAFSQKIHAT